ncbi:TPA: inovirus Gp2 family protein [Escherichia coli]|uniref:YagK/YfjJ domain-containing protein n=1 Tax=Escherichia coli TaxID=562 RepID=UPI0012FD4E6F|nr:inovirus Gp2 family protein [Escherichia coli]EES9330731.1 inovirus Gp2 family protein [Escherichia coli]EEZ9092966.1 inovirus Gp2 family protein [Escherichia coli]EFH2231392.1 inovirus Gp2 family protein [Escherichia coli]EFH6870273.1 inovirus Gp2 family protein [Escherichia coli]
MVSINHTRESSPYLSVPQDDFCIVNPGGCIVHFPANGRDILDINDPDFPEQYQRLLARLDYLTKLDTKASGQRNSGYSGF